MNVAPSNEDAQSSASTQTPDPAEAANYKNEPIGENWREAAAEEKLGPSLKTADDALLGPANQSAQPSRGKKRKAWKKPEVSDGKLSTHLCSIA